MATTLTKIINARVRGGMIEPLEHVELPEGQPLTITITVSGKTSKKKPLLAVWHLGSFKGRMTREEIYGDLI